MLKKFRKKLFGSGKPSILEKIPPERRGAVEALIAELRAKGLTYVGPEKLLSLAWAAIAVTEAKIAGDFVEAGVALGGSAIMLGKLKPRDARLKLFDVFAQIPPPGVNDGADAHDRYAVISSGTSEGLRGKTYYGYIDGLETVVHGNLASYDITAESSRAEFHKGLFEDTLHLTDSVALAHIDCDWYESVKVCIDRIYPRLTPGGMMIFDDYKSYSGCRRAVDEWLAKDQSARIVHSGKSVTISKQP